MNFENWFGGKSPQLGPGQSPGRGLGNFVPQKLKQNGKLVHKY